MRVTILLASVMATAGFAQEAPEVAFNNHCRTCHSLDEGDNRLGPNLYGIIGREVGSAEGYDYSNVMEAADWTWDAEQLDAFIENPDAVLPGHEMRPFGGIVDAAVRADIVAALEASGLE